VRLRAAALCPRRSVAPRRCATPCPTAGRGPEDVALLDDGHPVTGTDDGRDLRIALGPGTVDEVADTGGRPLGLEALPVPPTAVPPGLGLIHRRQHPVRRVLTGITQVPAC
jgi:hypothetical protein